jgi:hypothetical protein
MKTSQDISQILFRALNKPELINEITGQLIPGRRPENSLQEDVVIAPLANEIDFIQEGYININAYCKDLSTNIPDDTRLNMITHIIAGLIEDYQPESGDQYFQMSIESQHTFPDDRGSSYNNLRIRFLIEQ